MRGWRFLVVLACGGALLCCGRAKAEGLRLEEVLRHVYEHNPTLEASRMELAAAQEVYPQALAGWCPTLSAEAGIFATSIDSSNFSRGTGATTKDLTLSAQQPLFRGGRTVAETAQASALVAVAQAEARRMEQKIFLDTARAYMDVVRDRTILELRRGNEALLKEELVAARARYEAGDITVTDVLRGEGRLARARSETQAAEGKLEASNARFEEIAGLSPGQTFYYPEAVPEIPPNLGDALKMVEERNMDVISARYVHEAAGHGADATLRELFPQIFAYASYNKQYDPQPGIIDESETEAVGLRATLALYEGGAIRSRARQARRTANQRYIEVGETARAARAALVTDWKILESARVEIASRLEEISALKDAREGVRVEVLMGTRTMLDLLDADQELLESRTALAEARRDVIVTQFELGEILGLLTPERFGTAE